MMLLCLAVATGMAALQSLRPAVRLSQTLAPSSEILGSGNEATITADFANEGSLVQTSGRLVIEHPLVTKRETQLGSENPSASGSPHSSCGDPVNCVTGNDTEAQADFAIGGRGVGLDLTRTYNAQSAAASEPGASGYGWKLVQRSLMSMKRQTTALYQANGSTIPFIEDGGGAFTAPAWTQDTLTVALAPAIR